MAKTIAQQEGPALIPLGNLQPNPFQPRTSEDPAAITEIAANIHRNGLMQIPSARAVNGHYELVSWRLEEEGPAALAKHLKGVAAEWGVKLPPDFLKIAETYQPVSTETPEGAAA